MIAVIFHIVKRGDWDNAVRRGVYAPENLRAEGFIHCSTAAQVIDTANSFYRGQKDLIGLGIEESRLKVELKYEAPVRANDARAGERFPHLYGALNLDAVVRVFELACEEDGSFRAIEFG